MGTAVFLTMELVEGRSLAEALPATGLPIERVLTIGIAIADATSAAHQKGITHRDLKPGNIMLGEGEHAGRIKVLDFGLAKVVDVPRGAAAASMLPTEVPAHTADHSRGKSVTDINPAIPTELGRIIRRALAKDPERRYQTAKDLRNDLDDLKASLGSSESPLPPATSKATMTVHLGSVHVAGEERSTAVFRAAESPVQQRDEDLSSETRAFEHVTTAGKILEARQLRSVTTQRERRELRRRPAARQEIALDELGASANHSPTTRNHSRQILEARQLRSVTTQRERRELRRRPAARQEIALDELGASAQTKTRAAVPRPRAASPRLDGDVEAVEGLEHAASAILHACDFSVYFRVLELAPRSIRRPRWSSIRTPTK